MDMSVFLLLLTYDRISVFLFVGVRGSHTVSDAEPGRAGEGAAAGRVERLGRAVGAGVGVAADDVCDGRSGGG